MIVDEFFSSPPVSVAATADQLHTLRAVVRARGQRHDLSADAVADLVLAVDEAANILLRHTRSHSALTCTVGVGIDTLRVVLTGTTSAIIDTGTTSFSWFVLQTLVDGVALDQRPSAIKGSTETWAVIVTIEMAREPQHG